MPALQRTLAVLAVVALVWTDASGRGVATAESTAAELAAAVQRRYDATRDFSADFAHAYQGGILRQKLTEGGRVLIKKPGKMRWDYTTPERKQFVADGLKLYSYLPGDKQVIVSSLPRDDDASTPALFLSGRGNIARDFTPSLVDAPPGVAAGSRALKLVPKSPQAEYDWIVLAVHPATFAIQGLMTTDSQGGTSTFSFTNMKENLGLTDKEFTFAIPRGVDVVSN